MATGHEKTDSILRINRMVREVATGIPSKTGDELDPEASIYHDCRISLRYGPKDDSITVIVNEPWGRMPVYISSGTKPEEPHVFLQGPWSRMLEALHRKVVGVQKDQGPIPANPPRM